MKKSALLAFSGVLIFIITLSAANLQLKKEYVHGHYTNTAIRKPLPSFSYIKEDLNAKMSREYKCTITIIQADSNSIQSDSTVLPRIDFSVKNDTLFLRPSNEAIRTGKFFYYPVTVFTRQLKGVIATRNQVVVQRLHADSLSIAAYGRSQVDLRRISTNNLLLYGENAAGIKIETSDSLPNIVITLKNQSSFTADNIVVQNKTLHLSDSSFLRLRGRSVAGFGVK